MAQEVKVIKTFEVSNYAVVEWGNQYVACWLPKVIDRDYSKRAPNEEDALNDAKVTMYWAQGHYFMDLSDALLFAIDKEQEAIRQFMKTVIAGQNEQMETIMQIRERLARISSKLDRLGYKGDR